MSVDPQRRRRRDAHERQLAGRERPATTTRCSRRPATGWPSSSMRRLRDAEREPRRRGRRRRRRGESEITTVPGGSRLRREADEPCCPAASSRRRDPRDEARSMRIGCGDAVERQPAGAARRRARRARAPGGARPSRAAAAGRPRRRCRGSSVYVVGPGPAAPSRRPTRRPGSTGSRTRATRTRTSCEGSLPKNIVRARPVCRSIQSGGARHERALELRWRRSWRVRRRRSRPSGSTSRSSRARSTTTPRSRRGRAARGRRARGASGEEHADGEDPEEEPARGRDSDQYQVRFSHWRIESPKRVGVEVLVGVVRRRPEEVAGRGRGERQRRRGAIAPASSPARAATTKTIGLR